MSLGEMQHQTKPEYYRKQCKIPGQWFSTCGSHAINKGFERPQEGLLLTVAKLKGPNTKVEDHQISEQ